VIIPTAEFHGNIYIYTLLEVFDEQTNRNSIHEETQSRLKSGNDGCLSVQNVQSFSLLSKNINIRSNKSIIVPVVLYGCEVGLLH
jgi:hypothetical protein